MEVLQIKPKALCMLKEQVVNKLYHLPQYFYTSISLSVKITFLFSFIFLVFKHLHTCNYIIEFRDYLFLNNITNVYFMHVASSLYLTHACFAFEMGLPHSTSLPWMDLRALILYFSFHLIFHKYFWTIRYSICQINFVFF